MRFLDRASAALPAAFLLFLTVHGCGSEEPAGPADDVACGVAINFPDPGSRHLAGDDLNLRWEAAGGGEVAITLLRAGAELGTIHGATANDGYYQWTVDSMGGPPAADYSVAVVGLDDAACADTLAPLTILDESQCGITPAVRETTVDAGDDVHIVWSSAGTSGRVDVSLWYGPLEGTRIAELAAGIPDDGAWVWEGAQAFGRGTGDQFFVRVADHLMPACFGLPQQTFTIVDEEICQIVVPEPQSRSIWFEGENMRIEFTALGSRGTVDVLLVAGGGLVVAVIAGPWPVSEPVFEWTVDVDDEYTGPNDAYRVLVRDNLNHDCYAYSGIFGIVRDP